MTTVNIFRPLDIVAASPEEARSLIFNNITDVLKIIGFLLNKYDRNKRNYEDNKSNALMYILNNIDNYDCKHSVLTFCYSMIYYSCMTDRIKHKNELANRKKLNNEFSSKLVETPTFEENVSKDWCRLIIDEINKKSVRDKEILTLYYLDNKTIQYIRHSLSYKLSMASIGRIILNFKNELNYRFKDKYERQMLPSSIG